MEKVLHGEWREKACEHEDNVGSAVGRCLYVILSPRYTVEELKGPANTGMK
jgi:hypothetical protein